jgi:hypothetical protein
MNRLIITLFLMILLAPWAVSQQESLLPCSPPDTGPKRGDIVCENGQLQVTQAFNIVNTDFVKGIIANRLAPYDLGGAISGLLENIVKYGVTGYSVKYWTLAADPSSLLHSPLVEATGLVVIPNDQGSQLECDLPLALYCHGTIFGRNNVPSQPINFQEEFVAVLGYATSGYMTVAPDYVGMGEGASDFHPFLDTRTEAAASVDLMRAARMIAAGLPQSLSGEVFIAGHSEGAHAGLATLRSIAWQFPFEFNVKFTGLSSGPYDLSETQFNYIFNNPNYPGEELTLMVLAGCQEANCSPTFDLDFCSTADVLQKKYIQDPYEKYILGQDPGAREAINLPWPTYFRNNYLKKIQNSDLRKECLRSNDIYDWLNLNLTYLFYCQSDERVDPENSTKTVEIQRKNIPWYLFWLKGLINSFDSESPTLPLPGSPPNPFVELAPFDHVTCAFPSLYGTLLGFEQARSACTAFRSEAPYQTQKAGILVPPTLYFDAEIDFRNHPGQITSIEMVNMNDQVVREWEQEQLRSGRITLHRGNLPAGLYALIFREENAKPIYIGIMVQHPQPMVSNLYDPISPNPMQEEAILDLSLLEETVDRISIYDENGQLFQRMFPEPADKKITLQRQGLPAGDYLVEVRTYRQSYFLPLQIEPVLRDGLRVTPNPMKDNAWIELSDLAGDIQLIQLYSVDGRLIRSYTGLPAGTPRLEIRRGELAAGVYILKIKTSAGEKVSRLIVE